MVFWRCTLGVEGKMNCYQKKREAQNFTLWIKLSLQTSATTRGYIQKNTAKS
eukprot:m.48808 g.48808  ORF g.48808 m.48808 type:complete len:52 (+) comp20859_c0_seq1:279-434(+)